jgi:hypothetical protein
MTESIKEFMLIENAKTKIVTIAKNIGVDEMLNEKIVEELVQQVIIFLGEMQEVLDGDEPENLNYIMADMIVSLMITNAVMADKFEMLFDDYKILKEKEPKE